jgi:3-oxoacyl-[acyl-carrier protein] reductase
VHLTGRDRGSVRDAGEVVALDALDERAVEADLRGVVDRHGGVDVSVNLISVDHVQGVPLLEMSAADFADPVGTRLRTHFITARAAGRHMVARGSGAGRGRIPCRRPAA